MCWTNTGVGDFFFPTMQDQPCLTSLYVLGLRFSDVALGLPFGAAGFTFMFSGTTAKDDIHTIHSHVFLCARLDLDTTVTERTSYHIFIQWGGFVPFSPDAFPGKIKDRKSPPNFLFLRIFRAGRTYFLSSLFIAAEPLHHKESHLIYGPLNLPSLTKGS